MVTSICLSVVHFLAILLLVYLSPKIRKITQNLIHILIGFTIQSNDKRSLRYKQLTVYIVLGITILLFASSITASPSSFLYAQQQLTQNTTPTRSATLAIGVKITSPARGQQVPVGSLTISGTSKNNANSNDCTVYAIWDHLKPYQKVEPTGPSGTNDYSNWTFTYTSAYHLITNGTNQLTAKISCLASPSSASTTTAVSSSSSSTNLTKWYSINVTGITSKVNQTKTPVPIATITTNNTNTNSTTSATASTPSTTPSLLPFPVSKVNLNNNNKNKNNNDDNGDQSGNPGNQDKKSSSNENDNNKNKASNNHDESNKHNDSKNDKKSSSSSDKQSSNDDKKHKSSNNKNNDDHNDSKTDNSSSQPHKKHDNSKSKTTTHHHDDHSKKNTKHIIKEKTKEVKHKIKHLKKQINKKISKHI